MKSFLLFLLYLVVTSASSQTLNTKNTQPLKPLTENINYNYRSDSIDILNYSINLDITNFSTRNIAGNCVITFVPKVNAVNSITLDLLQLTTDSIHNALNYSSNDTLLFVKLNNALNIGDTVSITIYYHGQPVTDGSGWGGFYFSGGYAYNLGVGFAANPHVYGRVWFPCFDNFVERSTYDFSITTPANNKAACNGTLQQHIINTNTTETWNWKLTETIPTYLACVAIAPYKTIRWNYSGIQDTIPVELNALAADTTKLKNSFINLNNALSAFEKSYGPYRWPKVGYSLVPFNSGAMEHATNIAYPKYAADGTLSNETLYAHELSHHWWGDLATCKTPEDMWLNEGWASYSEHLFTENVYGRKAYEKAVEENHTLVIKTADLEEGGYLAVSGVPHEYTYGTHVYKKGASVAHSMRGYLGDSLFFKSITAYLTAKQYQSMSSEDFRDFLSSYTSKNMAPFFDNWVFNGGFTHIAVDSINYETEGSGVKAIVHTSQKLRGTTVLYNQLPIDISFADNQWSLTHKQIVMSGATQTDTLHLSFTPIAYWVDGGHKLTDAISPDERIVKTTGNINFSNAQLNINTLLITDSALVHADHHWVGPTGEYKDSSILVSPDRYFTVSILPKGNYKASAKFYYDGRFNGENYDLHLFDNLNNEDSLVLLFRATNKAPWTVYSRYTKSTLASKTDKWGTISIDSLSSGEYTLGMRDRSKIAGIKAVSPETLEEIYPNPTTHLINIKNCRPETELFLTDLSGKQVGYYKGTPIDVSMLPKGIYLLEIRTNKQSGFKKIVIE